MQHKLTTQWKEGTITVNRQTGSVEIRQGKNGSMLIIVGRDQFDAFFTDIDAAIQSALQIRNPTGVGFGGTILPIAPKPTGQKPKSIWDIVDDIENVVNPHT